jgi:hypothetical protein
MNTALVELVRLLAEVVVEELVVEQSEYFATDKPAYLPLSTQQSLVNTTIINTPRDLI